MDDEVDRELSRIYCPRFAELAVKKGFVSPDQVKEALSEQVADNISERPHRLIGRILLDKGLISPEQIEAVMSELF